MAEVKLFKRISHYEKDGETKIATNFFVQCGDTNIPIEIKYFEDKETGRDNQYLGRKMVLASYAELLPETEKKETKREKSVPKKAVKMESLDVDSDIPF